VFAPKGAWQSGGSASKKWIEYDAFGSLLPGRNYSSSSYLYGFNGMRKDDEVHGATGTSYDFGARLYDPRIGRWLSVDPLASEYAPVSPYVFTLNNPIIFIDGNGEVVVGADGEPVTYTRSKDGTISWSQNATADVMALGDAMLKTPKGSEIFDKMIADNRRIHIHVASPEGGPVEERILSYMKGRADGEVVAGSVFKKIADGDILTDEDLGQSLSFDPKTGLYDKTSAWDDTHILIKEEALIIGAALFESDGESQDRAADRSMLRIGGEEAVHSIQYQFEFYPAKAAAGNSGQFIPNEGVPMVEYEDRRHEKWAKGATRQMDQEYRDGTKP